MLKRLGTLLFRSTILLITFAVAFIVTTAFFDTLEHHMGYYDEGIQESAEVGK